jgi:DNA-binding MurR/RpiR family transcriptional regulator
MLDATSTSPCFISLKNIPLAIHPMLIHGQRATPYRPRLRDGAGCYVHNYCVSSCIATSIAQHLLRKNRTFVELRSRRFAKQEGIGEISMPKKSPPESTVASRLDALAAALTESDRRLADLLSRDARRASYLSANEAAREAGIHPTSAVRFARKLGYENYSHLRERLREEIREIDDEPAQRIRERLRQADRHSVLEALVQSEVRALEALPRQIEEVALERAAHLLARAERRLAIGSGHAASLASLFALRLSRSGYATQALDRHDWRTVEALVPFAKRDVLIVIALRQVTKPMQQLLAHAAERGIATLCISDQRAIAPIPDVLLSASRGGEGESQSLTVPMTICNALILELARIDDGASMRALDDLAQMRSALKRIL